MAALKLLLEEFGGCDLEPRLKYFRGEYDLSRVEGDPSGDKLADKLEAAFDRVERWVNSVSPKGFSVSR